MALRCFGRSEAPCKMLASRAMRGLATAALSVPCRCTIDILDAHMLGICRKLRCKCQEHGSKGYAC